MNVYVKEIFLVRLYYYAAVYFKLASGSRLKDKAKKLREYEGRLA